MDDKIEVPLPERFTDLDVCYLGVIGFWKRGTGWEVEEVLDEHGFRVDVVYDPKPDDGRDGAVYTYLTLTDEIDWPTVRACEAALRAAAGDEAEEIRLEWQWFRTAGRQERPLSVATPPGPDTPARRSSAS